MRYVMLAAAVALAGCGSARLEGGNERGGIVTYAGSNERAAFALADQHCSQFGRAAEMVGPTAHPAQLIFRCG